MSRPAGSASWTTLTAWPTLTATKRTAVALERRADALLRPRALHLTQLRLLVDIEERRMSYPSKLAADLLLSRQGVHHLLEALAVRGAVSVEPRRDVVRRVALTAEGRDLAIRGLEDLAPLLERLARVPDPGRIASTLSELESASHPPPPRWQL